MVFSILGRPDGHPNVANGPYPVIPFTSEFGFDVAGIPSMSPSAMALIVGVAFVAGYALRSFLSHRRRQIWRRDRAY
jgi:hypothetical protein